MIAAREEHGRVRLVVTAAASDEALATLLGHGWHVIRVQADAQPERVHADAEPDRVQIDAVAREGDG